MLGRCVLEPGKLRRGRVPDLDGIDIVANNILQVGGKRTPVDFRPGTFSPDPLSDVENYGRISILVHPDFLVVGDLANFAEVN